MDEHRSVVGALGALGGQAASAELRAVTSRRRVQRAVADGAIRRPRRGRVSLPVVDETTAAVRDLGGVRSHLSAALYHGWEIPSPPDRPMVTLRRSAHLPAHGAGFARVFWGRLSDEDLGAGVTGPARTVVDCCRVLQRPDTVAVADSALRSGAVTREGLLEEVVVSPRTGRSRAAWVVDAADARSANVFESLLRGVALEVPGLRVTPQVRIGGTALIGAADLVDPALGIVIEAESWEYHGGRAGFDRDVHRYTAMVAAGWIVVRFIWHDVRHDPDYVRATLAEVVEQARGRRS